MKTSVGIVTLAASALLATSAVAGNKDKDKPADTSLEEAAAEYIRFREDVAYVETLTFDNAEITREAHRRLGGYDPDALAAGWVAYAALVAAETPAFAEAIKAETKRRPKRRAGFLGGKQGLLQNLGKNPAYGRGLEGAPEATAAVLAMTASDSSRVVSLAEEFKQQAYAMQKTSWGKKRTAPSSERLAEVAAFAQERGGNPSHDMERRMQGGVAAPVLASAGGAWTASWGPEALPGAMANDRAVAVMDRILNLAARYAAGTTNPKIVEAYARSPKSERCLQMSKLTLDQCIAATRTPYEEAFCLGEHALNDIATCTGWIGEGEES